MTPKEKIKASKFLSLILRHDPAAGGITLDAQGWASTQDILNALKQRFPITLKIFREIVTEDEKQRYSFSSYGECIRANQGHSISVDLGLVDVQPPEFLFHGTSQKTMGLIWRDGILPMSRQYVHLSNDIETAIKVGQRHGDVVVLSVRAYDMFSIGGLAFYLSENGVWLTHRVPQEYIEIVEEKYYG